MATANDVLSIARGEIGYDRYQDPEAGTKYGRWFAQDHGSYFGTTGVPYCAMFASWCLDQAGVECAGMPAAATSIIRDAARAAGKVRGSVRDCQPGDVGLMSWSCDDWDLDHTVLIEKNCGSYVQTIEGNVNGGKVERRTRDWSYLRWVVAPEYGAVPQPQAEDPQQPGDTVNDSGFSYRAHVADYGWLPAVRDGQTAGTTGRSKQLEAIKIAPPKGLVLTVKIHIQDKGWVTYEGIRLGESSGEGSSANDPIIGTVGQSLRAEAIEIIPTENTTGKHLRYQVHLADSGWTGWVPEGTATGSVGLGKAIEAIQIVLE